MSAVLHLGLELALLGLEPLRHRADELGVVAAEMLENFSQLGFIAELTEPLDDRASIGSSFGAKPLKPKTIGDHWLRSHERRQVLELATNF